MIEQTGALIYDFNKSYYENFISNRYIGLSTNGNASHLFNDEGDNSRRIWYDSAWGGAETEVVNGVVVDAGINVRDYINNVYNGDQPTCLIDKLAREIGNAIAYVFDVVGLGGIGCTIQQAIFDIIDSFTDIFGSFICTATLEDTRCGGKLLDELKKYRDTEVMNTHQGMRIVKYYEVLGPRIVAAIDADEDSDVVYKYVLAEYVLPLGDATKAESGSSGRAKVFSIYFRLMDEMVNRYGIKVSSVFDKWKEEYK